MGPKDQKTKPLNLKLSKSLELEYLQKSRARIDLHSNHLLYLLLSHIKHQKSRNARVGAMVSNQRVKVEESSKL